MVSTELGSVSWHVVITVKCMCMTGRCFVMKVLKFGEQRKRSRRIQRKMVEIVDKLVTG